MLWPLLGGILTAVVYVTTGGATLPGAGHLTWLLWSLLTPAVVWYAERPERAFPRAWRHAVGVLAFSGLHLLGTAFLLLPLHEASLAEIIRARYARHLLFGVVHYTVILALASALTRARSARNAALARAEYNEQIARAEFDLARLQLRSTGVVERLTAVARAIAEDRAAGERALYDLTRMLRESLDEWRGRTDGDSPSFQEPDPSQASIPGLRSAALVAMLFLAFGLYGNMLRGMAMHAAGIPIPWPDLAMLLAGWCLTGLLAPLLFYAARHIALRCEGAWRKGIAFAVVVGMFAAGTETLARTGVVRASGDYRFVDDGLTLKIELGFVIVALTHAAVSGWRRHVLQLETAALSRRLYEARLNALMAQFQPHFLFNTLNSVVSLVHRDPAAAAEMTIRLRDLLHTIFTSDRQEVVLDEELETLSSYLAIESRRYGPRLRVLYEIDDEARHANVPALTLQPLVENAIRHGISHRASGGVVIVRAARQARALTIVVEDDGVGLEPDAGTGIGISNIKARLRHLYGEAQSFVIAARAEGGTRVSLTIPWARTRTS